LSYTRHFFKRSQIQRNCESIFSSVLLSLYHVTLYHYDFWTKMKKKHAVVVVADEGRYITYCLPKRYCNALFFNELHWLLNLECCQLDYSKNVICSSPFREFRLIFVKEERLIFSDNFLPKLKIIFTRLKLNNWIKYVQIPDTHCKFTA